MNKRVRIIAINEILRGFDKELDGANEERTFQIEDETRTLIAERESLVKLIREETRAMFASGEELPAERATIDAEREMRGKDLKEKRAITLTGNLTVVHKDFKQETLNPTFNQVSTLVDKVKYNFFPGGETYSVPYIKGYSTGDYKNENTAYAEGQPTWGYAEITKTKITIYTEVSEEFEKLGYADYLNIVEKNLRVSIRKKMAIEILKGDGATGHFMGMLNTDVIDSAKDLELGAIDENTLDDIVLSYGGDEDVEDGGCLFLSKEDLRAFKAVKSTQTKKSAYEIDYKNKTIDGVPYEIVSAANAHSAATTVAGDYTMIYGIPSHYEIGVFDDIEVKRSDDFKFSTGMVAFRARLFAGGNVTSYNGFLRIKKKA